ncbi:hemolysin-III related-domain-containing protein [Gaertneriomyces semiglobifer]|nr:hemolysin-III related-domain-containing protein [Gaertneriomyces semiglobifer]
MSDNHSASSSDSEAVVPNTKVTSTPSYEQRLGSARRRLSISRHGSTDQLEHEAAKNPWKIPNTPTDVLKNLSDYDKWEKKKGEPNRFTVSLTDMPDWFIDNVYILRGYRRITNSYRGCIKSLTYIHNETANIFTHMIGAIGFIILAHTFYSFLTTSVESTTRGDLVVVGLFFLGAIACLGLSTVFHTCACHSRKVAAIWLRGDYVGIVTLIMGSFVPSVYYGFFCNPNLQILYLSVIVVFGITTICVTVSPKFFAPRYRLLRTGLFVSMAMTGVVPLSHALAKYGTLMTRHAISMGSLLSSGAVYFMGAIVYATRIPERWAPGRFDIWGHSHQIFHVLVVTAAVIHYYGVVSAYKWWHAHNQQCALEPSEVARNLMARLVS